MTDRRPLGTGPALTDPSRTPRTDPVPRAQLAAERLPAVQVAEPTPRATAGRRRLGAGPPAHNR
ncbi:hypothetical protein ACFV2Z_39995 [Streptomyces sp. NPDC059688]|uniref:hypothetical protein n=1 Tax=Streptomyces sp. NPDC059688 TaxID=3346906 RepID=UPI00367F9F40